MGSTNTTSQGKIAALSTATGALSHLGTSYSQASALNSQNRFARRQAMMNIELANIAARDAVARGNKAAAQYKQRIQQTIGSQRASLAAQGVRVDEGSALAIQLETAELGALDAMTIRNNAWREAWGIRVEGESRLTTASMQSLARRNQARSTLLTGRMKAAGSILKGAYEYEKVR